MFASRKAFRSLALFLPLAVLGVLPAGAVASPMGVGRSAKNAKSCKSSEVERIFVYAEGKSGGTKRLTACVPRAYFKPPASVEQALAASRPLALKLAPGSVRRLLRSKAGRRLSRADAVTDASMAQALAPVRAAEVGHESTTETLRNTPPGTTATQTVEGTRFDMDEANPGEQVTATTDTSAPGATKREVLSLSRTMSRCPDADGIGRGVLKFAMKETKEIAKPGGGRVFVEVTLKLDATVLVHFDDEAHVKGDTEVKGDWSWLAVTRSYSGAGGAGQQLTRHAVGGTHNGTVSPDGRSENITTATTNASAPGMVIHGELFGTVAHMMTEKIIGELARESSGRASNGTCAHLVPEPASVHVKPGGTVAIGARLTESPRPKPVKASQGSAGGTVSPAEAEAAPVATFTYTALSSRPAGGKDTVTFTHVSRQGRASAKTMTVIYDEVPHLPTRYEGAWTRTYYGNEFAYPGLVLQIQGTALFVRHPTFAAVPDGLSSVPYPVESANVTWSASGSGSFDGTCIHTYSGSGSDAWSAGDRSSPGMTLEDVTNNASAPKPEPAPYYYSMTASNPEPYGGTFTDSLSGQCHGSSQIPADFGWFEIGHRGNYSGPSTDTVQKSADPKVLEGQVSEPKADGLANDQSWRFTGSG